MLFFVELWESVFKAGMTPALVTATHALFCLLLALLATMAVFTKSIHFFNLFVIAVFLYGLVIWFMKELEAIKLKNNEELSESKLASTDERASVSTSATKAVRNAPARKRKV
ncbi:SMK killer toxin resistance protein [Scheffersomyces spartinae]|uniref:SMK killer toxin resistance protein n=1 Tax=Scheffersomyces spartinae TaxID=45513 RepID=A0A9P7VCF4_9ASCO|nr:SMK killer toxin resistance protein [Scheffersomyces spartinae]KAG7195307.1 SMK killer toxin resistance protein [Scheffersomyces spartinae]